MGCSHQIRAGFAGDSKHVLFHSGDNLRAHCGGMAAGGELVQKLSREAHNQRKKPAVKVKTNIKTYI